MEISKAALGVLVGICLVGGMSGAYFATREAPKPTAPAPVAATATHDASAEPAVESTEAAVTDPAPAAPQAAAPQAATPQPAATTPAASPKIADTAKTHHAPEKAAASTAVASKRPSTPAPADVSHAPEPAREARATTPALEPVTPVTPPDPEPAQPPAPILHDLVVSADSVIGLQMETSVTSERARVEDQVVAQVTRDVKVGDRVAIPNGSKAYGEVTLVERGGRMRERARLGVRFTSIVLADGTRVPIETDTLIREGSSPTGESSAKIGGGTLGGVILGGILGGAKGAIIGGTAGAGAGTAAVLAGGRNPATLPSGAAVTVRLEHPATVTVEK